MFTATTGAYHSSSRYNSVKFNHQLTDKTKTLMTQKFTDHTADKQGGNTNNKTNSFKKYISDVYLIGLLVYCKDCWVTMTSSHQ